MTIYILLTSPGTDAGPFNLYSDTDGYVSAFATNVSKATLLSGYVNNNVPNGTVIVKLVSVGEECTNSIDVVVGGGPIPTTTTTTTINPVAWYYGVYTSPGAIVPIPTSVDINFLSGTAVGNQNASMPIVIPFNSGVNDFLWFAIPTSFAVKSNWFVTTLNQGLIGGPANQYGNLFSNPVTVTFNTITYNLYISTARTNVAQMTIS